MVSCWLLALLSISAADGLRGGAIAGGSLVLKSGAQSQRSEPVTPRAVVVLRGGGARRLRTHSTALSLSLSLHPRLRLRLSPSLRPILSSAQASASASASASAPASTEPGIATQWARYLQALEEKLTRTPKDLRRVRTGYAYEPPA